MRNFKYFYADNADMFSFFRIPKQLIQDEYFSNVSTDAKLLYGILLDRVSLSRKNDWVDEEGRVFIYFSIEDIMDYMNCGNKKAVRMLQELDSDTGVGLVEKVRQGLGKPNRIYVKQFCEQESVESPSVKETVLEVSEAHFREENTQDGHFLKCQNDISGNVKKTSQEVLKGHSNNTNINNTEINKTEYSNNNPLPRNENEPTTVSKAEKEKVKKEKVTYYPLDEKLNEAFEDFVQMRKKIKAPMTERGISLAMKRLATLSKGDNELAIQILNQSIIGSYRGLFELKKGNTRKDERSLAEKWGLSNTDWGLPE